MLQAQGRLELKVREGAYVLDRKTMLLHNLPRVDALELTEARALLEAESAALAAPLIDDSAIQELEKY